MNLRGVFATNTDGRYWFRSAKPNDYPIPDDGPVGTLLKALKRHPYRPAHVHFIVSAKGFAPITTHIFTPDSPHLDSDAVFGVKESLIGDFVRNENASDAARYEFKQPFWEVECDFVLSRS